MKNKVILDMQSIQGTMLLPLWGRAAYSREFPEILNDELAIEIVDKLNFDFSSIEKHSNKFICLGYLVRARKIENKISEFIQKYPKATIVNIGSGLDTSFSRMDNGKIHWYNLDMPDAIEFRQTLIPDSDRNICIPKSFFNLSWLDDIIFNKEDGILFFAGGVFYYFDDELIQPVFTEMAKRFPGGEIYFDAESKGAVAISNRMVKKTGNHGAMMNFYVNSSKKIENWSPDILSAKCERFFSGIPRSEKWGIQLCIQSSMLDRFKMMKFVHVKFRS